eukprot:m.36856 g.36856  ORF g.36856 m.36856 type:complete len:58 (+) comp9192_c1_seq1:465-638(+)
MVAEVISVAPCLRGVAKRATFAAVLLVATIKAALAGSPMMLFLRLFKKWCYGCCSPP